MLHSGKVMKSGSSVIPIDPPSKKKGSSKL